MKIRISIGLCFIFFFAISCRQKNDFNYSELYGYSIGDTLTADFEIVKNYGPYFSSAKYSKDSLFEVSTVGGHITYFHISVADDKFVETIDRYKLILGEPIQYYIGDTIHGVKLNHQIEHYTWYNKLKGTKCEAYRNLDSMQNGIIEISNDSLTNILCSRFIPNYNEIEEEIEIMVVE